MADRQHKPKVPAAPDAISDREKDDIEQEMLDKLPEKTTKAQEWGHGYATGKGIATSGDLDRTTSDDTVEEHAVKLPNDVYLETDDDAVAQVYCSHCKKQIGRVQTVPPGKTGEEVDTMRRKVEGELSLIADEHRALCRVDAQS